MIEHGPGGEVVAAAQTVPSEPPASLPAETTVAAFFDLDNTVLRGASVFHLAKGLYRREFFTGRDIAAMLWKQVYFSVKGENLNHVAQIREQALGFVAGHSVAEIARIGEEVYDEVMADKIWPGTRALAEGHLESGDDVWLVTASPVEVATVIADRLGLTGALGTVAESVDGIYTGRLVGDAVHGPAKAVAVEALASERGYDLARCAAYSDSANDIPMLSLVGYPCAVNPDAALRQHARAQGWQVRDFRNGRRAAKLGIRAAGATALAGALAAAATRRRSH
ncbi:MAG TPA: HAD-IB family hydrolase [Streptomyces sp.]|nr:HAD-IB family hydrolase [Pedococcus sp.]HET6856725.1 HAD-IB family hydrolase [Streptomyces sp.]